jgi:hypothetical protein
MAAAPVICHTCRRDMRTHRTGCCATASNSCCSARTPRFAVTCSATVGCGHAEPPRGRFSRQQPPNLQQKAAQRAKAAPSSPDSIMS